MLRRFRATPLRPITYIAADVTANLAMTLLGMVGVVVVGWLVFRCASRASRWFLAVILSLAVFSAGYVIGSLAPGARTAQVMRMVVFYPMMFLSGAGIPWRSCRDAARISDSAAHLLARLLRGLGSAKGGASTGWRPRCWAASWSWARRWPRGYSGGSRVCYTLAGTNDERTFLPFIERSRPVWQRWVSIWHSVSTPVWPSPPASPC